MMRRRHIKEMFALREPPPERIRLAGRPYELARVFKHDFFAATCLYEIADEQQPCDEVISKVVIKFGRTQGFHGLTGRWVGRLLSNREQAIYAALAGIRGVPRWVGRVDDVSYAIEYIDCKPLDHLPEIPPGFFDRLREIFDAIHARGVAYCDANKRSNILVADSGEPFLVDYQISIRRRDDWPWPYRNILGSIVKYLAAKDLYHLYKHKRRLCPEQLTAPENAMSRRRSRLHLLHRTIIKPWRALRRKFLRRQYENGRLVSPTAELEDHHQPEKATWRKKAGGGR